MANGAKGKVVLFEVEKLLLREEEEESC